LLTGGDLALAAVLVSNLAFALALVALYALSVRYLTPERSIGSLWFLSLAPGAIAFSFAYSESLFLLLAVCALLAAELRRPWLVGLALAAAAVSRVPGILLLLPVLAIYVQQRGWRPTREWVPLVLAPLALVAQFVAVWLVTDRWHGSTPRPSGTWAPRAGPRSATPSGPRS
jgi:Gpi18-like mannosyltransferase